MALVIRKLLQLVVVIFIVTFLTSLLVAALPGDPTVVMQPFATTRCYEPDGVTEIDTVSVGEDTPPNLASGKEVGDQLIVGEGDNEMPFVSDPNAEGGGLGGPTPDPVPCTEAGGVVDNPRTPLREELGLNESIFVRYGSWAGDAISGDFGNYYNQGGGTQPVVDRLKAALPVSLQLMIYAQLISLVIAIPLGVFTAYRANTAFDKATNFTAFAAIAFPSFALGLFLAYFVGVKTGIFPPSGYVRFTNNVPEHFRSMVLPSVSLAAGQVAVYMRLLRTDMIATLREDFILMAKSKGITDQRVLWRHALRPSSLTLLTVAGLNVGTLIGGSLVIEQIFFLPGMGFMIAEAILTRQYLALQSAVVIVALVYVAVNFLLDFFYTMLDPRIRTRST